MVHCSCQLDMKHAAYQKKISLSDNNWSTEPLKKASQSHIEICFMLQAAAHNFTEAYLKIKSMM